MSKPEETLALHLRAAGLECEREYRFAPPRRWRFDFAFPGQMLAVEIEGVLWTGSGRHQRALGMEQDCEKYNTAVLGGWRVLRFVPRQVQSGAALQVIEAALARDSHHVAHCGSPS